MMTNILLSKDFEGDMTAFSIALMSKYAMSLRPSAIKILIYADGTFAAYWNSNGDKEAPAQNEDGILIRKQIYVDCDEDARAVIDRMNGFIAANMDSRMSKPFIAAAGNNTVVFVVAEDIHPYSDDEEDNGVDEE